MTGSTHKICTDLHGGGGEASCAYQFKSKSINLLNIHQKKNKIANTRGSCKQLRINIKQEHSTKMYNVRV